MSSSGDPVYGQAPSLSQIYGGITPGQQISPYLNIDPSVFRSSEPQYILPEGNAPQRGRFELAFSHIGGGVLAGFGFGASTGFYRAIGDQSLKQLPWKVYRTQMLNYLVKHASGAARPLGIVMLFYSGFGVLTSKIRGGADDELNTVISATLTGLLYKSVAGLQSCAKGGAMGAGLGVAAVLVSPTSRDNLKKMYGSVTGH